MIPWTHLFLATVSHIWERPLSGRIACFLVVCVMPNNLWAQENTPMFYGGVSAVDISPTAYPVVVNGMFNERSADQSVDPLYARCIALDDGATRIAICIVDTCMMPRALIDRAKEIAAAETGLSTTHITVAATHTHSAPAAMGCLGSRMDENYAAWLPPKIAEAIVAALNDLKPARIGWASIDDWAHTHNRRWIRRADRMSTDPFGDTTVRAHMHPGYESTDVIGPSGPVDPGLSVLAIETPEGVPLGLLANYSQHYFGSPLLSADYFGVFSHAMAERLGQSSSEGPFVAMMSQGTSGDLMWMDYGSSKKDILLDAYSAAVADKAMEAYNRIEWHDHVPLGMVERRLPLKYRVPDAARLAWAQGRVEALAGALPTAQPDIYAHEAIYLHGKQETELVLQAIGIGDLSIATLPNEVYALTGLKLKAQSPFEMHFNIELANGAEGYIPPPEQFTFGGYTTWPARTAGLEVNAEPQIVEALLGGLEEVSGESRKASIDENGLYAQAILEGGPVAYWRLNDMAGRVPHNSVKSGPESILSGGAALYLPGVGSGSGSGAEEALRPSRFSGPNQINRAVHFADGALDTNVTLSGGHSSIALWVWLGEPSGASAREGTLLTLSTGETLNYRMTEDGSTKLSFHNLHGEPVAGNTNLSIGEWHFVVLVMDGDSVRTYLDGATTPTIHVSSTHESEISSIQFAMGLEGKLDEIALFDRTLSPTEIANYWSQSGIAEERARKQDDRDRAERAIAARANPPKFPAAYAEATLALQPVVHATLDGPTSTLSTEAGVRLSKVAYAMFEAGRLRGSMQTSSSTYTTSFWFRNETANNTRPVTCYLFSRGPNGDAQAPGDHLGIGGTYRPDLAGKLIIFNGNASNTVVSGTTVIPPGTWNHVVLIRDGNRVTAYLNGATTPEIKAELPLTASDSRDIFLGARCDNFAPLRGYIAEFALFDRALSDVEVQQLHTASGQPTGTPETVARKPSQRESAPLSPEEAIRTIHVPDGYAIDLVASEPLTIDPVAFDWDTQGRLWVVEMTDYPLGGDGAGGRIRVLEDGDGDGAYESANTFAENLSFPNGILTWRDGVIVTAAPDIFFLRDTDGDGVSDERTVLISGLSEGNQQLRANGLRWGLDNWVYVAAGGHHGNYALETKVLSTITGEEIALGSRDFRFKPDTGEVIPASGPTQFGRNRDDWGHWFGTQNSHPLWHYVLPDHYLRRNPHLVIPDGRVQILGTTNPPVYPTSEFQKRFHTFVHSGHYTSACSGMVYRDDRLFPPDELNGFACEPFHNVVQRIVMQPEGVSFSGSRSGEEGAPDFFASSDRWCRPVMVRTGPDGNLWIADMYRYMIEHPQWLPEEGKSELLPYYREGDEHGRLYRIRRDDEPASAIPNLEVLDSSALVARLASTNGWLRDKAQQMLLWRNDHSVVPALREMAAMNTEPRARLHALCTLDGLDALDASLVVDALDDPHSGVRENALRLAESQSAEEVVPAVTRLVGDSDPRVRLQLAFTLGEFPASTEAGDALATLMANDFESPFTILAALSSALPHHKHLVAKLGNFDERNARVRIPLLELALAADDASATTALLVPVFDAAAASSSASAMQACVDLLDLLSRRETSLDYSESETNAQSNLSTTFLKLTNHAKAAQMDGATDVEFRIACAALLSRIPEHRDEAITFLLSRVRPLVPPAEFQLLLRALAGTSDERVPETLIAAWPGLAPSARNQVLDQLLSKSAWTSELIASIGAGVVHKNDFDPTRRTQLLNHPDNDLREQAQRLLASASSEGRSQIVADFKPALSLSGNVARGLELYKSACIQCHKHGDLGTEIGPDFRTVSLHSPEKLLANILDPNLDIQPGYHAYNCELKDWEQLYGLIVSENAVSISLKVAGGTTRNILRSDIEKLESTNQSLMPEGWEEAFTHQDMADLIAFVKSAPVSE